LTFHYRETPNELRPSMLEKARSLMEDFGFRPSEAIEALEAKPPVQWNKGRASIYILRTAFGVDWSERIKIIYAGDDDADEDAMTVRRCSSRFVYSSVFSGTPWYGGNFPYCKLQYHQNCSRASFAFN
jgi:trehalose 6-phosphate synthase/phosphatase